MQPNQPEQNKPAKSHINFGRFKLPGSGKAKIIAALLVAVVVFGGAYWFWYRNHSPSSNNQTAEHSFIYKNLVNYQLAGKIAGAGIKMQIPKAFGVQDGTVDKYTQVNYSQIDTPNGPPSNNYYPVQIAHLALSASYSTLPLTDSFKQGYAQTIINTNPNSATTLKVLQTYVTQRLPSGYSVTMGTAKSFTNPNIKTDAWLVTYTAKAKAGQDSSKLPDLNGEVIVALGKQTTYYVMLDAVTANWQSNQSTWQNVINSLQIDQ